MSQRKDRSRDKRDPYDIEQAERWGERCRANREHLGLTQEAFAAAVVKASDGELTLSRFSVAHWEQGDHYPALRYRRFIARVLEQPYDLMFAPAPTLRTRRAA